MSILSSKPFKPWFLGCELDSWSGVPPTTFFYPPFSIIIGQPSCGCGFFAFTPPPLPTSFCLALLSYQNYLWTRVLTSLLCEGIFGFVAQEVGLIC